MTFAQQFPAFHPPVHLTPRGVPYLKSPGVALLAAPTLNVEGLRGFLEGFDPLLNFRPYLADDWHTAAPGDLLAKLAGQLCYMAFSEKRSINADVGKYLTHIKSSGHGSVIEHANFSFLFYGIDRSVTHELVRHRAGLAYSQVSQRYVSGKVLRFVERPEYQSNPVLHGLFIEDIERAAQRYEERAELLLALQRGGDATILSGESRTEARKKVQQCARSLLPNETEAPIVVTGNARAWRHVMEMRASQHADLPVRALAVLVRRVFLTACPEIFADYQEGKAPDGTDVLETPFRKV